MSAPDAMALAAALERSGRTGVTVHSVDTLDSTNAWLSVGDGRDAPPPALCVTDHQPAGAGRRGRAWQALPGNLTFSLLQTMPLGDRGAGPLALVTGIAVANALGAATALPIRLKWPNDLLVGGSKVGGLLLEARHEATGALRCVGGIGINVVADERLQGMGATSLAAHGVDPDSRDALLVNVAVAVFDAWDRFADDGWSRFAEEWRALDALAGQAVQVHDGPVGSARIFHGTALGVDADGALRVLTPDGERRVHAADVSVRAENPR